MRPRGQILKGDPSTVGVRNWASILDEKTKQQALETARCPVVAAPVALMPDAHLGKGATVGSVIVTREAIIPSAVGVDIGCGMVAALTDKTLRDIGDGQAVLSGIRKRVPAGFSWHRTALPAAEEWIEANPVPRSDAIPRRYLDRVGQQLCTLGGGNHFVEISEDETGRLWIVLHTGSRGIGNRIATMHMKEARRICERKHRNTGRDLAFYTTDDEPFDMYIEQMLWAQAYAWHNREMMLDAVIESIEQAAGPVNLLDVINCHHNYATKERHMGETLWVTRKGAIRAGREDRGVVPGSMGTDSYIVRGLGNPLSYESAAHGAGRVMSRNQAKKTFTPEALAEAMTDKAWERRHAEKLVDEAPWAYKPIEEVMADQTDLVAAEHKLVAAVNYRGT